MLRRKNKMCDSFPPFNAFKIRLEICLGFSSETAVASQCCFRISNDVFKITLATVQLERILDRIMDTQFIKFICADRLRNASLTIETLQESGTTSLTFFRIRNYGVSRLAHFICDCFVLEHNTV